MWPYVTALVSVAEVSTGVAMAHALATPGHDRLTRMLTGQGCGQTLLERARRARLTVVGGALRVDETLGEQPHAALLDEAAWGGRRPIIRWALASPWCSWGGPMAKGGARWRAGSGAKGGPPSLTWPGSGSVMRARACR
jgi:hypothetical protein